MKSWRLKEEVSTLTYMLFRVRIAEAKKARVKYNGSERWSEALILSPYLVCLFLFSKTVRLVICIRFNCIEMLNFVQKRYT